MQKIIEKIKTFFLKNIFVNKGITGEEMGKLNKMFQVEPKIKKEDFSEDNKVLDVYGKIISSFPIHNRIDLHNINIGFSPKGLTPFCSLVLASRQILFNTQLYSAVQIGSNGIGKSYMFERVHKGAYNNTGAETPATIFSANTSGSATSMLEEYFAINFDEVMDTSTNIYDGCEKLFLGYLNSGNIDRKGGERFAYASCMFTGNFINSQVKLYESPYLFASDNEEMNLELHMPEMLKSRAIKDRINAFFPLWFTKPPIRCIDDPREGLNSNFMNLVFEEQRSFRPLTKIATEHQLNGRDYDNILESVNGLIKLFYPEKDYEKFELEALTEYSYFLKQLVYGNLYDLSRVNSWNLFMIKLLQDKLEHPLGSIIEGYASFDVLALRFAEEKEYLYLYSCTSVGEKILDKQLKLSKENKFNEFAIQLEKTESDITILKAFAPEVVTKFKKIKNIELLTGKLFSVDKIEDENAKTLIRNLLSKNKNLEKEIQREKKLNEKRYEDFINMGREIVIQFDEIKNVLTNNLVKNNNQKIVFTSEDFPINLNISRSNESLTSFDKTLKAFNIDDPELLNTLIAYDKNNNSYKLVLNSKILDN